MTRLTRRGLKDAVESCARFFRVVVARAFSAGADAARERVTVFHGTDVDSALRLLNGEPLDAAKAAASKIDGPPGFFLTTEYADAEYFALRRAPGGVLQYEVSGTALVQLDRAGPSPQAHTP